MDKTHPRIVMGRNAALPPSVVLEMGTREQGRIQLPQTTTTAQTMHPCALLSVNVSWEQTVAHCKDCLGYSMCELQDWSTYTHIFLLSHDQTV